MLGDPRLRLKGLPVDSFSKPLHELLDGDLTDDDSLKNEGKVDRATGSVKDKVGDAADKVKDVVNPNN